MTVLSLFTSKNGELLTTKAAPASHPPVWLAGKEKILHVGEGRRLGGTTVKSRVKSKLVQGVLRAVKCSLIRVPFFFVVVQMILIIGMHNFFNMQIKSFKT